MSFLDWTGEIPWWFEGDDYSCILEVFHQAESCGFKKKCANLCDAPGSNIAFDLMSRFMGEGHCQRLAFPMVMVLIPQIKDMGVLPAVTYIYSDYTSGNWGEMLTRWESVNPTWARLGSLITWYPMCPHCIGVLWQHFQFSGAKTPDVNVKKKSRNVWVFSFSECIPV